MAAIIMVKSNAFLKSMLFPKRLEQFFKVFTWIITVTLSLVDGNDHSIIIKLKQVLIHSLLKHWSSLFCILAYQYIDYEIIKLRLCFDNFLSIQCHILRFKVCILAINNWLQILIKQVRLINRRVLDSAFRSVTKLDPTEKLWYLLQGKETLWVYLFTFFSRQNKYWCNLSFYHKTLLNWNTRTVLWNFTKKNESKSRKEKRIFLNVLAEFLLLQNHLCNVYEAWIQSKKNCLSKK